MDTLPTLPEWSNTDEVDGWMFDTEPGLPPEAPSGVSSDFAAETLTMPLDDLIREPRFIGPQARFDEVASAVAGGDGDPIVVADAGRPLGVVRPGDVVRALLGQRDHENLLATTMMSSSVYCLRRDAPATRALELITQRGAREVAVIDPSGRVIGVVLPEDVTRALAEQQTPTVA